MNLFQKTCGSLTLLTVGALLADASAAQDGPPCGARDSVVSHLTETYGESRQAIALDARGIIEIWVNENTGTFTVTITTVEGVTCLLSAGEHWTDPAPLATGPAV
ncbi:hypothetical protein [Pontivivens insulae]|uniref:PepSY domain-containing protein n=1 Tax=Pontivivens insulae TaxID=1639689 RepID=A0A2R8ADS8_9RHOB|nr:hypothetical protein [Pontivivens insulae]RED14139.1 hypothetical protein DFR53_1494 [Pontivivens insulae]SPF30215.1 hypothetical protein POI8812_02550 [Pontivivens insulae]